MSAAEFWKQNAPAHQTPRGKSCPEGWDVWSYLPTLTRGNVLEIGCGCGRLAPAFNPEQYLGVDISEIALRKARINHPSYRFELHDGQSADTILLYTVLLHVPDENIQALIDGYSTDRVIVAEILGRQWRRDGDPPVYNREAEDYVERFRRSGYRLSFSEARPYAHYPGTQITFLVFDREAA